MEVLKKIGLTNDETKVYTALGKLHNASVSEIITSSKVASSHIYIALNSLLSKGLISYEIKGKRKIFQMTSKEALEEIIRYKKEEIQKLDNELKDYLPLIFGNTLEKPTELDIKVYEGIGGLKSAVNKVIDTLEKGEVYYILGAPRIINERLNGFFQEIHTKRVAKGIKYKIIYNANAIDFARERKKQKLTEVRIQNLNNTVEIAIYKDIVQMVFLEKKYRLIEIKSADLAKTLLAYFEALWKQSTIPH